MVWRWFKNDQERNISGDRVLSVGKMLVRNDGKGLFTIHYKLFHFTSKSIFSTFVSEKVQIEFWFVFT